jgi:hypothetical protein
MMRQCRGIVVCIVGVSRFGRVGNKSVHQRQAIVAFAGSSFACGKSDHCVGWYSSDVSRVEISFADEPLVSHRHATQEGDMLEWFELP